MNYKKDNHLDYQVFLWTLNIYIKYLKKEELEKILNYGSLKTRKDLK